MKTTKQRMDEHIETILKESSQLKSRLETLYDMCKGKTRIYVDKEKLDQLFFQAEFIEREAKHLNTENEIYYNNRGRASAKKSVSSKENGKKGGRPPKEISDAKKRRAELEEKFMDFGLTPEEQKEDEELMFKIAIWNREKRGSLQVEE